MDHLHLQGDTTLQSSEEVKDRERHLKHEREKLLKERKVATELALKLAQDVSSIITIIFYVDS